ncbi:MAG TPA: hypothetical protein VMS16_12365, partial [Mycobacterium sp.]|nr:hypothetical protein [Mycobacterium sp.]
MPLLVIFRRPRPHSHTPTAQSGPVDAKLSGIPTLVEARLAETVGGSLPQGSGELAERFDAELGEDLDLSKETPHPVGVRRRTSVTAGTSPPRSGTATQ